MLHKLKIRREFAETILSGDKKFEIRKNDRGYQKGDEIQFFVVEDQTGRTVFPPHKITKNTYRITYVLSGWGLYNGYVALGIEETN